jgi:hypothetical protein
MKQITLSRRKQRKIPQLALWPNSCLLLLRQANANCKWLLWKWMEHRYLCLYLSSYWTRQTYILRIICLYVHVNILSCVKNSFTILFILFIWVQLGFSPVAVVQQGHHRHVIHITRSNNTFNQNTIKKTTVKDTLPQWIQSKLTTTANTKKIQLLQQIQQ